MTSHERMSPETNHNSHEDVKDRKIGKKVVRNWAIAASVVAVLGVGGGALVINNLNHSSNGANNSQHESQNSSEKPARKSIEELTDDYKFHLPNEQGIINRFEMPSGMSDQEAAETLVSRLNDWMSYGANSDFDKIANRLGDDETEEHLTGLTSSVTKDAEQPIRQALFEATLPDAYKNFAKHFQEINANTLDLYAKSVKKQEPYKRSIKLMDTPTGKEYPLMDTSKYSAREITFTVLEQTNASAGNGVSETNIEYANLLGTRKPITVVLMDDGKTTAIYTIKSDWN